MIKLNRFAGYLLLLFRFGHSSGYKNRIIQKFQVFEFLSIFFVIFDGFQKNVQNVNFQTKQFPKFESTVGIKVKESNEFHRKCERKQEPKEKRKKKKQRKSCGALCAMQST